jgi:hypothetical protein
MTLDAGIGANSALNASYNIDNSSVWEPDLADQAYRSQGSTAGTRTKQTFSVWLKRTELGGDQYIFEGGTGNANDTQFGIQFSNSNKIQVMRAHTSGGYQYLLNTNRLFRDTSAWYHIVVAVDTTLSTADNRVRLYVNGVEETSFANRNNPSQNDNLGTFAANAQTSLGVSANLGKHIAAYMAHPALVYNAQLPPTDFGEFDSDSGIWKPIDLSGVTFGTYGYWLKNETSNQMYNDSSGNSNNFGRWDGTIYQSTDTPTNNFATWQIQVKHHGSNTADFTFSGGGTSPKRNSGNVHVYCTSTMAMSSGKWYMEYKVRDTTDYAYFGGSPITKVNFEQHNGYYLGQDGGGSIAYGVNDGNLYYWTGSNNQYTESNSTGDIIGVALDKDNNKIAFSKNGTFMEGSNGVINNPSTPSTMHEVQAPPYVWAFGAYTQNIEYQTNMGGYTTMSISSAATDENGYGAFEYAPPTGYYALCTKNLAEYG